MAGRVRVRGRLRGSRPFAGDHDPSGEDIDRDFTERTDCWDQVRRVALTADQVQQYGLPPQPGKVLDSRARGFEARHGVLVQVELDALAPDTLRDLFATAIAEFWKPATFKRSMRQAQTDRKTLWSFRNLRGSQGFG